VPGGVQHPQPAASAAAAALPSLQRRVPKGARSASVDDSGAGGGAAAAAAQSGCPPHPGFIRGICIRCGDRESEADAQDEPAVTLRWVNLCRGCVQAIKVC